MHADPDAAAASNFNPKTLRSPKSRPYRRDKCPAASIANFGEGGD
jgi:hypothetical protein